jgi:hypothetical protein
VEVLLLTPMEEGASDEESISSRAAAKPERIAPSIVAGKPVLT